MAINRWFGGIPVLHNVWHGGTFITQSSSDNYLLDFNFKTDSNIKLAEIQIIGTPLEDSIQQVLSHSKAVGEQLNFGHLHFHHLVENSIVYATGKADAINTWIIGHGNAAVFGRGASQVVPERTFKNVIDNFTDRQIRHFELEMKAPDTNLWILEEQIDPVSSPIIQPGHQAVPLAANELNVVSSSALDTLAGTGLQKLKFSYYSKSGSTYTPHTSSDVEMAGATPVNIIGSYADVYFIEKIWGTQWGSTGWNQGNILFQEDDD